MGFHLQEPQWYTSMPSLFKHQGMLLGRNEEEVKNVRNFPRGLQGGRWPLRAAEVVPSVQLPVVSEVLEDM